MISMRTFRNLTYALLVFAVFSLAMVIIFAENDFNGALQSLLNICVSMFSVALVTNIACLLLYFDARNSNIVVLKRRGSKAYGELLQHKMKLIDVMDEEKTLADWETFLYAEDEFQRIKKFLYEEYFLLLGYEPYLTKSAATASVDAFYEMHKELENFIRSVAYDRIEYNKYRRRFIKVHGQDIAPDTPEETLTSTPELDEAYNALCSANEYALSNIDRLLVMLDAKLIALDKHFRAGVPWSTTKPSFDAQFQLWLGSRS